MGLRPQFNVICNRCGKPRGLAHACVSSRDRTMTVRASVTVWTCGKCGKAANPLTHACKPKSDFGKRKAAFERRQKARARRQRQGEKHDYQACQDPDCPRPLCKAFKGGWKLGYDTGHDDGWALGYDTGHKDGIADCPRPHGTG
jgi:hypothetical protein